MKGVAMANDWHQLSLLIYCVCLHLSIAVVTVVGVVAVVGGCIIVEGARCIRLLRPSTSNKYNPKVPKSENLMTPQTDLGGSTRSVCGLNIFDSFRWER